MAYLYDGIFEQSADVPGALDACLTLQIGLMGRLVRVVCKGLKSKDIPLTTTFLAGSKCA
jgi:hypothetical protein